MLLQISMPFSYNLNQRKSFQFIALGFLRGDGCQHMVTFMDLCVQVTLTDTKQFESIHLPHPQLNTSLIKHRTFSEELGPRLPCMPCPAASCESSYLATGHLPENKDPTPHE